MPDPLTRAIRARDRAQAFAILDQMRGQLSSRAIRERIVEVVEHLAWEEGDRAAARWVLYRAGRREILSSQ
ncbi:MAG: hypothetical protein Q6J68_00230 [Thermostichales cyanobacterium SZTDM-1c_bins_54]